MAAVVWIGRGQEGLRLAWCLPFRAPGRGLRDERDNRHWLRDVDGVAGGDFGEVGARDPARISKSAIFSEVGEPQLGTVPWHLGLIPAGEGQAGAGGVGPREGVEIPSARRHRSWAGSAGWQGDEFVDDLAVGFVPFPDADQSCLVVSFPRLTFRATRPTLLPRCRHAVSPLVEPRQAHPQQQTGSRVRHAIAGPLVGDEAGDAPAQG